MTGATYSTLRVLIVDDIALMRELLRELLEPLGCVIAEAVDGVEALAMVASFKPDLVLLDIMMPDMHGIEVCERIRVDHDHTSLRIVMVTALGDDYTKLDGLGAGADEHITKPIACKHLIEIIDRLFGESDQDAA